MTASFEISSCVRGFHAYKEVWDPSVGDRLRCDRELGNSKDRYSVTVLDGENIVGHLPKQISRLCSLFLRQDGLIECVVTSRRRYSSDLPQGGLEIPCKLMFTAGSSRIVRKMKKLINSVID